MIILADSALTRDLKKNFPQKNSQKSVLSDKTTPLPASEQATPTATLSPTPQPESNHRLENTPAPTLKQNQTSLDFQTFIYPGSQKINETMYEHSDNPEVITDWYKNKIRESNMSSKSFVQTNTNGNILNKLAGSDGKTSIQVQIEKRGSSNTKIFLTVSQN